MNPLSTSIAIPFRKGSVNCQLTIKGIYRAEMEINIPIISPSAESFTERPVMVQKCCYLYAALASVPGLRPTMDECMDALAGPKSRYIQAELDKLMEGMVVELLEYHKQFEDKKSNGAPDPLLVELGGPDNGLMPSSLPGSQATNSGASRRGK